jgi:hypothetical protein
MPHRCNESPPIFTGSLGASESGSFVTIHIQSGVQYTRLGSVFEVVLRGDSTNSRMYNSIERLLFSIRAAVDWWILKARVLVINRIGRQNFRSICLMNIKRKIFTSCLMCDYRFFGRRSASRFCRIRERKPLRPRSDAWTSPALGIFAMKASRSAFSSSL